MQTGDGLLVRLRPLAGGLSPQRLGRLADAAGRFGNGVVEVTRRGNLQIRGLTAESAAGLARVVEAMGIAVTSGVPVETGPLAGLDAREIADPRPLARAIREAVDEAGLALRLGPKVSIVVDGGGLLPMSEVAADIRIAARRAGKWLVSIGGTAKEALPLGMVVEKDAANAALSLLRAIAAKGIRTRGADLSREDSIAAIGCSTLLPSGPPAGPIASLEGEMCGGPEGCNVEHISSPVGVFGLSGGKFALGVGLRFGQTSAQALHDFAEMAGACGASEIRFAPGRALLAVGLVAEGCDKLREAAHSLGFVIDPADPRLFIAACAGSPACNSAFFATKEIGAAIASSAAGLLDGSFILHLSGCPKGCARPAEPVLSLVGVARERCCLRLDGHGDAVIAQAEGGEAATLVAELALGFHERRRPGETARAFLDRSTAADPAMIRGKER
jgi:precorrin-3B synthase